MNSKASTRAQADFSIHPATLMGLVSLTVASLDNQIEFYKSALGFKLHRRAGQQASLGAGGADLLQLTAAPNLKRYRVTTGLYHFAVLFPNRRELARALARLHALQYRNHPTDHIMTKTTYLDDPEGNGIELYCESPEDGCFTIEDNDFVTRRTDGTLSDGREPLDVAALFRHLKADDKPGAPLPPETRVGHVHLHVRNVQAAAAFLMMAENVALAERRRDLLRRSQNAGCRGSWGLASASRRRSRSGPGKRVASRPKRQR